ncbi:MAG TPA: class I adenylate cyclase [Cellvibrio sp.]|nr:class I adenylate cyclase [Cellvibrio sp.]
MTQSSDDTEPLDEGVDRKQLLAVRRNFLIHNQAKYVRTLAALSERQQQLVKLLPLLFHVNHPMLPGYINHNSAAGVYNYIPSDEDIHTAKTIARSFTYARDLLDRKPAIDALFIMGSLGSIAHSDSSDIDVWVCYNPQVNPYDYESLKQKCHKLSQWAANTAHIEANFFLMDAQKFGQGQSPLFSGDASGSAQHFLLLDEFYRSAVWLAGKLPLWWFVPAQQESQYVVYSRSLLEKRFVREEDLIDFGGVPSIPTNEFIGAGVWQLYKGIDAPYKSVLKLLLLECYSNRQFNEPLSLSLKRKVYSAALEKNINADELDSYVLIYQRLEKYLLAQNQLSRLDLVRRCFYFKTAKKISRPSHNKSWQRTLLEHMVSEWGWQQHHILTLDGRSDWKSPQVISEHNLLVQELTQSYQLLTHMQKHMVGDIAVSSDELSILGRKLHAAFEVKAGKIDWINPEISQDLNESSLCFVQASEQEASVWKVYRGSQQDFISYTQVESPIKRALSFMEAFLWCYCNGILSGHSRIDIISKNIHFQSSQLYQLYEVIKSWLPLPRIKPSHETFTRSSYPTRVLLLFNIGIEPQGELLKKGMLMLSNHQDALGFSGLKENLVVSAEVVYSNSWGEITSQHFAGDALVNCLLYYLRLVPPHKDFALPELNVHCLSLGQGSLIEQRVRHLWQAIAKCFYQGNAKAHSRFIFEMAGEYLLLQFVQLQPQIFRFHSYEKLLDKLAVAQPEPSTIVIDALALNDKPLRFICAAIQEPGIYFFYKVEGPIAQVSIVDHNGSLFSHAFPLLNRQALLRPLYRFINAAMERQLALQGLLPDAPANLGKIEALKQIHIYEILGDTKQKNVHLEARSIDQDIDQLPFISIGAMAEPGDNLQLRFTLFCEGKIFSEEEFGERIYSEVAQYIFCCRQSGEIYPCYITDLDLSRCQQLISPHRDMQLIHYLQIKVQVENKLSLALQNL